MTSDFNVEYNLIWVLMLLYGQKHSKKKEEKLLYNDYGFYPIFDKKDRIEPKIPENDKAEFEIKKERLFSRELRGMKDPFAVKTQGDIVRLHFGKYYDEWHMQDYFGSSDTTHGQSELLRGDSIKDFKSTAKSFRRWLVDALFESDEKFYEIITDLIQLQEIILAHYECKDWTGERYGLVFSTIYAYFQRFDDSDSYIKSRPTLKNSAVRLYEKLIVDDGISRCEYAPAIAFLLLSTLLQSDFLPVYTLLSLNRYTESFQYALTREVGHHKIERNDYCISFNDARNNFNQHCFANIEIEAHGKKRRLSDCFGNLLFQTGDHPVKYSEKYCDGMKKNIPCFVTKEKHFQQLKDGTLLVKFTTRDIPGMESWFFELILDRELTITAASSGFCFNRFKNEIKEDNRLESRIFVRDEGPGAWGSSFTIPKKSWWRRYYSSCHNQTEEWYYTDKGVSYTVCSSDEIIDICTIENGHRKWETVTAYFD